MQDRPAALNHPSRRSLAVGAIVTCSGLCIAAGLLLGTGRGQPASPAQPAPPAGTNTGAADKDAAAKGSSVPNSSSREQASGDQTKPLSPEEIDLAVVKVASFDVTTSATGELEARKQIDIRNQLEQPTTIVEIIKEGTQVQAGEVLVRLNSDNIQSQVDEESLRVESSRAEVVVAENNYSIQVNQNDSDNRKAALEVEIAELDLRKWQEGEVTSKRQTLQLALERATRELDRLKEKYDRSVELEKRGFLARDELKRDEVAYLEAEAALQTARLNITVYNNFEYIKDEKVKKSAVDQARAELSKVAQKADSELAKADADRKNKREQLRLREQKLDKLKEQLELSTLRAPSDGLVVYATSINRDRWGNNSEGSLDVGRQVTRNQQLIILPDTTEMVASVRVHESMTGRMKPGQPATIKVDALGGRSIPGAVESIGVIAESGGWRDPNLREYTVKVRLETSASEVQLKPSMRAEAQILLDKVERALTIPIQAVFSDGLVRYVLVPDKNARFRRVPVRVGRRSDRFAEVTTGLSQGDRVLIREPAAGEVIEQPWEKAELAAVGLALLPDGRVMPVGGPPGSGGRSPGGGRPAGGSGPNGAGPNSSAPGGSTPGPGGRPAASNPPALPPAPTGSGTSPGAAPSGVPTSVLVPGESPASTPAGPSPSLRPQTSPGK